MLEGVVQNGSGKGLNITGFLKLAEKPEQHKLQKLEQEGSGKTAMVM